MARMACGYKISHDAAFSHYDVPWNKLRKDHVMIHRVPEWKKPILHKIFKDQAGSLDKCGPKRFCVNGAELKYCPDKGSRCAHVNWKNAEKVTKV